MVLLDRQITLSAVAPQAIMTEELKLYFNFQRGNLSSLNKIIQKLLKTAKPITIFY